jgi:signal transduction histidine kinase/DNA-binding response OmpR family regulator
MQIGSSRINILLVDDNESNLLALETILRGEDRHLIRAASGEEALQYLLNNEAAVILMDVRMPGIDGLETAELIRGRKKSRDVPIIFLTAYDSPDKAESLRGYSLGAVDYLIKPVDPDALKSKVAVFVELFKKTEVVKRQAALLHEKNIQLENANFERLGKLVELGQRLTAERDPKQLLHLFCEAARDILGARYSSVGIAATDGRSLRHLAECGHNPAAASVLPARIHEDLLSGAPGNRTLRISSESRPPRLAATYPKQVSSAVLAAPICLADNTLGWLYLADRFDGDEFSEADERLAMTLTSQLAVAYQNANLYSELLTEVAERKEAQEAKERLLVSEQAARFEAELAQKLSSELLISEKAARADAEAANRMKDEFLATVSHELRTPLNAVLGWASMLRQHNLDETSTRNAVETIERNAKTLTRIVGDILDASRIITGKLNLHVRPVEVAPIVAAAADVLSSTAALKGVRVDLLIDSKEGYVVSGDQDRLQQVFWNLLSNAIKFTPAGGQVTVTLTASDSQAEISFIDTGQGITPEFLPYVFDSFRQADSSTTRRHGGLGLGLAIVRQLVDLHGGTVSAESPGKDKGATFMVRLPLAAEASGKSIAARPGIQDLITENNLEGIADLTGLSILVVDDDPDGCDLLTTFFNRHGAQARGVNSTREALAMLETWKPHVLLSDIGMRGEDGYDLIRQVRELESKIGGTIPAAAITAYATSDDRMRVLASGYQAHLAKPFDTSQLIDIVVSLVNGNSD